MSHEVLITRGQSIFNFFANPGRGRPQHPRQPAPASTGLLRPASAWICKKNQKCFVFWLSGPHRTSNFGHQSLIRSDLNYTTMQYQRWLQTRRLGQVPILVFLTARLCYHLISRKIWSVYISPEPCFD